MERTLKNADGIFEYSGPMRTLPAHRVLMELNPSAVRSQVEGLEETSTVHRLRVPELLRRTLASTTRIGPVFSVAEMVRRNEKCWRPGDQRKAVGRVRVVSAESKPARKPLLPGLLVNFSGGQGNGCKREKHERQSPR